jgi:hypothetical protein
MLTASGYMPDEPHGSSPVTTRTVVWSPKTALAGIGLRRGSCGFRLWRTPTGYGKPDAGVCVVLSCKAVVLPRDDPRTPEGPRAGPLEGGWVRQTSRRPEPAGRSSRRHKQRNAT